MKDIIITISLFLFAAACTMAIGFPIACILFLGPINPQFYLFLIPYALVILIPCFWMWIDRPKKGRHYNRRYFRQ